MTSISEALARHGVTARSGYLSASVERVTGNIVGLSIGADVACEFNEPIDLNLSCELRLEGDLDAATGIVTDARLASFAGSPDVACAIELGDGGEIVIEEVGQPGYVVAEGVIWSSILLDLLAEGVEFRTGRLHDMSALAVDPSTGAVILGRLIDDGQMGILHARLIGEAPEIGSTGVLTVMAVSEDLAADRVGVMAVTTLGSFDAHSFH